MLSSWRPQRAHMWITRQRPGGLDERHWHCGETRDAGLSPGYRTCPAAEPARSSTRSGTPTPPPRHELDDRERHFDAEEQPQHRVAPWVSAYACHAANSVRAMPSSSPCTGSGSDDAQDGPDDHDRTHQIRVQGLHRVEFGQGAQPPARPHDDSASCTSAYVHGVAKPAVTTRSYQALARTTRR